MSVPTTEGPHGAPSCDAPVELLVVLGPDSGVPAPPGADAGAPAPPPPPPPLTALEALGLVVPVDHCLPPRLALVAAPRALAARLAELPYVVGVYDDDPPGEVTARLSGAEQLFVAAWVARVRAAAHPRPRAGEGEPWDAPGFSPPDAPGAAGAG